MVGLIAAALCGGCGAEALDSEALDEIAAEEEVDSVGFAIGEATCATATPDATLNGSGNLTISAPYDNPNCDSTYVIRVNNWVAASNKYFIVTWADARPANKIACEGVRTRIATYKLVNGAWQYDTTKEGKGSWSNVSGNCTVGAAGRLVPSSGTWKAAVQGIWNVQGTPTYKIRFQTS
jgi:hypothetical protein